MHRLEPVYLNHRCIGKDIWRVFLHQRTSNWSKTKTQTITGMRWEGDTYSDSIWIDAHSIWFDALYGTLSHTCSLFLPLFYPLPPSLLPSLTWVPGFQMSNSSGRPVVCTLFPYSSKVLAEIKARIIQRSPRSLPTFSVSESGGGTWKLQDVSWVCRLYRYEYQLL